MTDNRTGGKAGRLCALLVFTLLLVAVPAIGFDFYYDLNDDTLIKDVISGAYTGSPGGYSVQLLYPLSWLISLPYRVAPDFAWYGLFLCICQFGTAILIAVRLTALFGSPKSRAAALLAELLIFLGLFFRELVIIQYSVTAGICMAGAIFLFATSDHKKEKNAVWLLLVLLAFSIRTEVCLMLLPFLLAAGVFGIASEEKILTRANFRKYVLPVCGAALGMLMLLSLDMLAYHGNEWSNFRDFFDARTKLYDFYGLPDYGSNSEFYDSVGLSRESYTLLENYNFALDDSINTWLLESVAEYQKGKLNSTFGFVSKNSVPEELWLYKNRLLGGASAGDLAVAASYLLYLSVCLLLPGKGSFWQAARSVLPKTALLLVIRSVLWLYLYMIDRVLERVTEPLIMAELACVLGFLIRDAKRMRDIGEDTCLQNKRAAFGAVYTIAALGLFAAALHGVSGVREEYAAREKADGRWYALMDYCRQNGQSYYMIDVYSATSYEGASYSEKIFRNVDNSYKNFDYCGGWLAKSPLARQKLSDRGYRDVQSALIADTGMYFVAAPGRDMEWLEAYYAKRGAAVACSRVDEIYTDAGETAFYVYRIRRADNEANG